IALMDHELSHRAHLRERLEVLDRPWPAFGRRLEAQAESVGPEAVQIGGARFGCRAHARLTERGEQSADGERCRQESRAGDHLGTPLTREMSRCFSPQM